MGTLPRPGPATACSGPDVDCRGPWAISLRKRGYIGGGGGGGGGGVITAKITTPISDGEGGGGLAMGQE